MLLHYKRQAAVVLLAFSGMLAAGVSCAQDAILTVPNGEQSKVANGPRARVYAKSPAELRASVSFDEPAVRKDVQSPPRQDGVFEEPPVAPVGTATTIPMDSRQVKEFVPPTLKRSTTKPVAPLPSTPRSPAPAHPVWQIEPTIDAQLNPLHGTHHEHLGGKSGRELESGRPENQVFIDTGATLPNRYAQRTMGATQTSQQSEVVAPVVMSTPLPAAVQNHSYSQAEAGFVPQNKGPVAHSPAVVSQPIPTVPANFRSGELPPPLWWDAVVAKPMRLDSNTIIVDVIGLMSSAAQNSARIQAVRYAPWITGTQVLQAQSAYDPTMYSDSMFDSTSDPVGNSLTTGGPPRLEEDIFGFNGGLRGENRRGATYDVGQRMGHTNSNSTFFTPNDQGTARMAATWTQPLMRNRGMNATRSLILTAQFDSKSAEAEYQDAIQQQLAEVANTYWNLYQERATYLQRVKHLERAVAITQQLERRRSLDAVESQILRANAAVANRRAELAQSDANIRNAESRIRALLTVAGISDQPNLEMLPVQPASLTVQHFDIEQEVAQALKLRPEIQDLNGQIGAARVRLELAKNQTKPLLNLVMEGYVAGLRGESDVFGAWGNQFAQGRPGYAGGIEFEMPYRNRAAHARLQQRRYELTQLEFVMKEQAAIIRNEVESAIRTLEANRATVKSRQESLDAVNAELAYQEDRWQRLAGDSRLGQLQLDDLLNAHVRLLQEEQTLLAGLVEFNLALVEVQRATGSLVRFASGSRE